MRCLENIWSNKAQKNLNNQKNACNDENDSSAIHFSFKMLTIDTFHSNAKLYYIENSNILNN